MCNSYVYMGSKYIYETNIIYNYIFRKIARMCIILYILVIWNAQTMYILFELFILFNLCILNEEIVHSHILT